MKTTLALRYEKHLGGWQLVHLEVDPKLNYVAERAGILLNEVMESYIPALIAIRETLETDRLDGGSEYISSGQGVFEFECAVVQRSRPHSR